MKLEEKLTALWLCLDRRIGAAERAWLEGAERSSGPALAHAFSAVSRRIGRTGLVLSPTERFALRELESPGPLAGWRLDDLARGVLLLSSSRALDQAQREDLVVELYRGGTSRERQAILKSLALLPEAPLFLPLALQASRDPDLQTFEAVACDNTFPAERFPEPAFNELVLRVLSFGLRLERVAGLDGRRTAGLARLAYAFARDRRESGRGVPGDFGLLEGVAA